MKIVLVMALGAMLLSGTSFAGDNTTEKTLEAKVVRGKKVAEASKENAAAGEKAEMADSMPAADVAAVNVCKNAGQERRVEISYGDPQTKLPCEVKYKKVTEEPEADPTVLWQAANSAGYCEMKVQEFLDKLQGWGWECSPGGAN